MSTQVADRPEAKVMSTGTVIDTLGSKQEPSRVCATWQQVRLRHAPSFASCEIGSWASGPTLVNLVFITEMTRREGSSLTVS